MDYRYKKKQYVTAVIQALAVCIAFTLNMRVYSYRELLASADMEKMHAIFRLIWDFRLSLNGYSIKELAFMLLLTALFLKTSAINEKRIRIWSIVPAFLFSCFEIFGRSFKDAAGWEEVLGNYRTMTKAGIKWLGFFLFFYAVCKLFLYGMSRFHWYVEGRDPREKSWFTHNGKSILAVFLLILVMWLPYSIAYFPGLTNYDFFDELDTFYGNDTNSLRVVVPISEEVTLNNNNPVLQTMFAVWAMKAGDFMGSPYAGLILYCYAQMVIFALILSYSLYYLSQLRIRRGIRIAVLLFYGLLPWHPNFALTTLKDTNFAFIMLLYLILFSKAVLFPDQYFRSWKWIGAFAGTSLLLMLLRNNGVYVLIVVDVLVLLSFLRYWKQVALGFFLPAFVYLVLITHMLYPALKISPGSQAEMYSLPFQQIARLVRDCKEDIEPEDEEVIRTILTRYDELEERYEPELADPVKSTFNKYATPEDMRAFWQVWFKYLRMHPGVYIQAAVCDFYGYFYPEAEHWLIYTDIAPTGENYGLVNNESFTQIRNEMNMMAYFVKMLPGFGMLMSVGFYTWLLILQLVWLMYNRQYRRLLLWMPSAVLILTVILGPVNTMPRYVYPVILAVPALWCIACSKPKESLKIRREK